MVHPLTLGTSASLIHCNLKKTALPFASFFQYLPTTLSSRYIKVNETVVIYKKRFYVTERSLTPFNSEFTIKNLQARPTQISQSKAMLILVPRKYLSNSKQPI